MPNGPDDGLRDNHGCERAVSRAAARFMMRRRPWEYPTRDAMQIALAGSMPRDEYLKHRSEMARELVELFGLDGTQQVFEIGSGDGVVARHLARQCRSLDCADISRTFLDAAQETCGGLDNVRFHLITTDFLDFLPAGEYDFGYSLNVFVHRADSGSVRIVKRESLASTASQSSISEREPSPIPGPLPLARHLDDSARSVRSR